MITYNQAFDYYHAIYRMIRILTNYSHSEFVELDRIRIWDFYLLFPEQVHTIALKQDEKEIKQLRKIYIRKDNPYNKLIDKRKIFERLRPYQLTALHCLASYGIINKSLLAENRISIISKELLREYESKFEPLTATEQNVVTIMVNHFYKLSMFGPDGLKSRTNLMVSRYD
jgi:hypothetical protein